MAIDTHQGQFNMLLENLESMLAARDELAAAELSRLLRVSRVQGKAIYYGCAIPFVAVAAPSHWSPQRRRHGPGSASVLAASVMLWRPSVRAVRRVGQ